MQQPFSRKNLHRLNPFMDFKSNQSFIQYHSSSCLTSPFEPGEASFLLRSSKNGCSCLQVLHLSRGEVCLPLCLNRRFFSIVLRLVFAQRRVDGGHPDGGRQAPEAGGGKDPVQPHLQHRQPGGGGDGHLHHAPQTQGSTAHAQPRSLLSAELLMTEGFRFSLCFCLPDHE